MKATAFQLKRFCLRSTCCLSLLTLAAGCGTFYEESFTYKLWNNESFRHFNEPAADARLQLFVDRRRSDVLVEYDEVREKDGATRRRAFFVNANLQRIEVGLKPHFVHPNAASKLEPIRILRAGSGEPVPVTGLCVVVETNHQHFTMHSDGKLLSAVTLPTYGTTGGVKKALLTPLAVTGDTLVVGVVAGVIAASAWAHTGYPGSPCR